MLRDEAESNLESAYREGRGHNNNAEGLGGCRG